MSGLPLLSADMWATVGTWLAVLLTLAVLSRLLGENVFSRIAQHLFVGVAAGYAVGMVCVQVLWPRMQLLLSDPAHHWHIALFGLLGLTLLVRGIKPTARVGDAAVSVLLGAGAGLALVGVLRGTLLPQAAVAVAQPEAPVAGPPWLVIVTGIIVALSTILALAAFHYRRRENGLGGWLDRSIQALGSVGRHLLMIAFGALLAGAWLAFFAALQGRVTFIYEAVQQFVSAMGLVP